MARVEAGHSVYGGARSSPNSPKQIWQYINRRCSDWRVITGKERAKEYAALLARIEADYGVDRYIMLGLWGMESSFGDVIDNPKYMRPVIPALAALAWGEPRRRRYWEAELLNALTHRRARLGAAGRDDRLLGRRHGPYPMDAGGVAAHGRRLRPRRPRHAVRQAGRCAWPALRAIWSSAANIAAARPGAARSRSPPASRARRQPHDGAPTRNGSARRRAAPTARLRAARTTR